MHDDEVVEALRAAARTRALPPPAPPEAVAEAEEAIGFPLPPLLRRLYLEVANGGFGPDEGILGVSGGRAQGNFGEIAELYQDGPDPSGRIPAGLVPVYDWGCTIWSLVDFRDPAGFMWCNHEGEHWPQGITLAEWLTGTTAGALTVDTMLESQPASPVS
ncbi:hypothetical protein QFZ82_004433 [Streptomyces sp. V4I23]|uniref:SMI1/KNR4 family protein n=1 Tax=Streptomyces sp. V4I23 TaxID=3042282 RepID=UPI0027826CBF|nr:SMI1/KNR4 family protein [Streptomyces sp. V4I23]MDQ1009948.1 hypothetical protein [Streptomyces sp. V4I23]